MTEPEADCRLQAAAEAARSLGWEGPAGAFDDLAADELADLLAEQLAGRLADLAPELGGALAALSDLHDLRAETAAAEHSRRTRTLANIHDSLARLRPVETPEALLERATEEVCVACGFDRAVLFRVSGTKLVAESVHVKGDPEWAAALCAAAQEDPIPLDALLIETEALRRKRPVMIHDAEHHPGVYQPLRRVYKVNSYVCAPIVPEGRVIGFFHADHYFKGRRVDEFDRDALFAYAEGFGFAFERAVLLARLRAQGAEVRRLLTSTEAVVRAHEAAEVELVRAADAEIASMRSAAGILAGQGARLEEQLTRREREVLRLLAAGATNSDIAEQLFVSEGTVKSHVRRILRRLGARNRVEAASIYLSTTSFQP